MKHRVVLDLFGSTELLFSLACNETNGLDIDYINVLVMYINVGLYFDK